MEIDGGHASKNNAAGAPVFGGDHYAAGIIEIDDEGIHARAGDGSVGKGIARPIGEDGEEGAVENGEGNVVGLGGSGIIAPVVTEADAAEAKVHSVALIGAGVEEDIAPTIHPDRKSTRLNSSH